jgi:hypothetical protein
MMIYGTFQIKYGSHRQLCNATYTDATAYDHFNEHRNTLRMTTGSASLDSLIDSVQEGQFYLFYGSDKTFLDGKVSYA